MHLWPAVNQPENRIDYAARNIYPMGVCCNYGAPEHLRAVQLQRQGRDYYSDAKINGPSADMYSLGAVMYELVRTISLIMLSCHTC